MTFIEWSSELSVGFSQIDEEHKKLVDLVNRLHEAMSKGKSSQILGSLFDEMVSYTQTHFHSEERLMKDHAYPEIIAHVKEHQDLIRQVGDLHEKYKAGTALLSIATMDFLKKWLASHILGTDLKLGNFLSARI